MTTLDTHEPLSSRAAESLVVDHDRLIFSADFGYRRVVLHPTGNERYSDE